MVDDGVRYINQGGLRPCGTNAEGKVEVFLQKCP